MENACKLCFKLLSDNEKVQSHNDVSCADCFNDYIELGNSITLLSFHRFILSITLRKASHVIVNVNSELIHHVDIKNTLIGINKQIQDFKVKITEEVLHLDSRSGRQILDILHRFESLIHTYSTKSGQSLEQVNAILEIKTNSAI